MQQYKSLISTILEEGSWCEGRNGRTLNIFGHTMTFYMKDGFPIPTVKQTYWKTAIKEMYGFTHGFTSAEQFRSIGVGIWDKNANEEPSWLGNPYRAGADDLGSVYGEQWRNWKAFKRINAKDKLAWMQAEKSGYELLDVSEDDVETYFLYSKNIDMMMEALKAIHETPTSRRILFHGWNPADMDAVALPPCHLLYQFGVDVPRKRLSLNLYIRSNDIGLGAPFNIVEAGFLLNLFAHLTGYEPYKLTYMIGDAHLYENQLIMANEMLCREPYPLPQLKISDRIPKFSETGVFDPSWLDKWTADDFQLVDYKHHPAISVEMKS